MTIIRLTTKYNELKRPELLNGRFRVRVLGSREMDNAAKIALKQGQPLPVNPKTEREKIPAENLFVTFGVERGEEIVEVDTCFVIPNERHEKEDIVIKGVHHNAYTFFADKLCDLHMALHNEVPTDEIDITEGAECYAYFNEHSYDGFSPPEPVSGGVDTTFPF